MGDGLFGQGFGLGYCQVALIRSVNPFEPFGGPQGARSATVEATPLGGLNESPGAARAGRYSAGVFHCVSLFGIGVKDAGRRCGPAPMIAGPQCAHGKFRERKADPVPGAQTCFVN
jgi:hypothetical protein